MRKILTIIAALAITLSASAQFADATLRLDYIFSGNAQKQNISLHELCASPHWYGKTRNMTEVPMKGCGDITMTTLKGDTIYRNSFSTLFQEWLTYPEAQTDASTTSRSFENTFLVPMPTDKAKITVQLYDNRQQVTTSFTHIVDPKDILIRHIGESNVMPYDVISAPADEKNCIDVAFVAEGYTEAEMAVFLDDVRIATEAIFKHEPFRSLRDRFRIVAVKSPSAESGASEPSKGIWKNTVLHSSFDTFYSDRYLTTLHLFDLHNVLAGIPYEHIIVLVNTSNYGGGGILNSYNLTMTHHEKFRPVVVHEFGHSFAGLADEYAYPWEDLQMYPHDIEPWEENITTLRDFRSKWADMVTKDARKSRRDSTLITNQGTVGLYESAGYSMKGIYRPSHDCRMRTNETPEFCAVCQRAIRRIIDFYTAQ